jgi:hypothetical protein
VADAACKTTCYKATTSFHGMVHSGDINKTGDLPHHIKVDERLQSGKEFAVFVSGFSCTKLTKFQEHNPVLMIANHAEKVIQVPEFPTKEFQANLQIQRLYTSSQSRLMLHRLEMVQSALQ